MKYTNDVFSVNARKWGTAQICWENEPAKHYERPPAGVATPIFSSINAGQYAGMGHTGVCRPDGVIEDSNGTWANLDRWLAQMPASWNHTYLGWLDTFNNTQIVDYTEDVKETEMAEAIIWIEDDHCGYGKGTGCYYSPQTGVIPLPDGDCVALLNNISQQTNGKDIPTVHSSSSAPWVIRAIQASVQSDYTPTSAPQTRTTNQILEALKSFDTKKDDNGVVIDVTSNDAEVSKQAKIEEIDQAIALLNQEKERLNA